MTSSDYLTAVEVLLLAVWIEVALRVTPFSRLVQRLSRLSLDSPSAVPASDEIPRLMRFVAVVYEILPFPPTCLRHSLVLHALLGRRAVRSRLCLGVARNGAALDAHAWIECDGVASDAAAARFDELMPTPVGRATLRLEPPSL